MKIYSHYSVKKMTYYRSVGLCALSSFFLANLIFTILLLLRKWGMEFTAMTAMVVALGIEIIFMT